MWVDVLCVLMLKGETVVASMLAFLSYYFLLLLGGHAQIELATQDPALVAIFCTSIGLCYL